MGAFESAPPYVVRGTISGPTLKDEVQVTAGTTTVTTTHHGTFSLEGLSPNTYSVSPQSGSYLFLPDARSTTLGPDRIGIHFKAYHWNALSLEDVTNGALHVMSAITNGQTVHLQTSTDFSSWSNLSTNTGNVANLLELHIPMGDEPALFYRWFFP
jgi:hypothetical protein